MPTRLHALERCLMFLNLNTTIKSRGGMLGSTAGCVLGALLASAGLVAPAQAATIPQVSLTAPAAGATVSGTVTLSATASTDATQSDEPEIISFYVDNQDAGFDDCGGLSKSCSISVSWDATGLSGQHTIIARVRTRDGLTVNSAPVTVTVYSGTIIKLTPTRPVRTGKRFFVSGDVVARADGKPAPGLSVKVTVAPVVGSASSLTLTTDANGHFTGSFLAKTNSVVSASTTGSPWYGASRTQAKQPVTEAPNCKLSKTTVRVGRNVSGYCTVALLPKLTTVKQQYRYKANWYSAGRGPARSTRVPISITFNRQGRYAIRLIFAGNRVYARTVGTPMPLRVR